MKFCQSFFYLLLAYSVFSCYRNTELIRGDVICNTIYDTTTKIKISINLDSSYNTLYEWETNDLFNWGCSKNDTREIYNFQNKKTLFLKYPDSFFNTSFYFPDKKFEFRNCKVIIYKEPEFFRTRSEADSLIIKWIDNAKRQNFEMRPITFKGFEMDTILKSENCTWAIIKNSQLIKNNKSVHTLTAFTYMNYYKINILFENTEDADKAWEEKCLYAIKTVKVMQ